MITKEQLIKMKKWFYPYISTKEVMRMSGWKFYIYGETVDDSYNLCSTVVPIVQKYNITMKVASQHIIDRNTNMVRTPAWSTGVIYLRPELFQFKHIPALVDDLNNSLRKYRKKGDIKGARSINGKLHYRFDLNKPVLPSMGVTYSEYITMYRGEHGEYNIPNNPDIANLFNIKL